MVLLFSHVTAFAKSEDPTCALLANLPEQNKTVKIDPTKTKERFEEIAHTITTPYRETITQLGAELMVDVDWKEDEVNAYATQIGKNWILYIYGGLYRHASVPEDTFALVVCHELGHLLGGAPFVPGSNMSAEGQADFWATSVCLKKYFKDSPKTIVMKEGFTKSKCDSQYVDDPEAQNICYRTALAASSMGELISGLSKTATPDLNKKDLSQITSTKPRYPEAQCRVDTYIAGSLCNLGETSFAFEEKLLSNKLITDFRCNEVVDGQITAQEKRPKCWFNEKNYTFFTAYQKRVKSKDMKVGLLGGSITLAYYNHLPGVYKIKLVPDSVAEDYLTVENPEFTATLPAASNTGDIVYKYNFKKSTNKSLKLKVIIEHDGKVVMDKDNTVEISPYYWIF